MIKKWTVALVAALTIAAMGTTPASATTVEAKPRVPAGHVVAPDGKVVKILTPAEAGVTAPTQARIASANDRKASPPDPRAKPTDVKAMAVCTNPSGVCYTYNTGWQDGQNNWGGHAKVKVGCHLNAIQGTSIYHSLGEIAVESADQQQTVEVGWGCNPNVNGGSEKAFPFVYHWVNNNPTCYNTCGFTHVSGATYVPGNTSLANQFNAGSTYDMGLWHDDTNGRWWAYINGWSGFFSDTNWTSPATGLGSPVTFNRGEMLQFFGEIADDNDEPCADMGLGWVGSNTNSARFGDVQYYNSGTTFTTTTTGVNLSTSRIPAVEGGAPFFNTFGEGPAGSQRAFRYGGPGHNATGTGVGTRAAC